MSFFNKILITLGIILTFGLLTFIIYKQDQSSKKQLAIESQIVDQKQLVDEIVRSKSQYATSNDLAKLAKDNDINLSAIKKDLESLDGKVSSINIVSAHSKGQKGTGGASTGTGQENPNPKPPAICSDGSKCPDQDTYGYLKTEQKFSLSEKFEKLDVPIGAVGFSAWKDKPWSFNISGREYKIYSVVGTDENQRQYFYNKLTIKIDGKDYEIPIDTAITDQLYPEAKFSFMNPRLFLGLDYNTNLDKLNGFIVPSLNIGLMSYGVYKTQPDFSLLEFGLGYDPYNEKATLLITPAAYNIGKHLVFMNNLYVAPSIHFGLDNDVRIGLGFRAAL